MKHKFPLFLLLFLLLSLILPGCDAPAGNHGGIAATTLPVYQFASIICEGTGLPVTRLVTQNVSCLHDYSLTVSQVKAIERSDIVLLSGAGLEDFLDDVLAGKQILDASQGIQLLEGCHEPHEAHADHTHAADPHIWLSPANAMRMAENICQGLSRQYPAHADRFALNLQGLLENLQQLQAYGNAALSGLQCRALLTFHDGFAYFADAFNLEILAAIEEEAGAEASARELVTLIGLVRTHDLPAVFTEENGSVSAADVICAETGIRAYALSMAMTGDDYFAAMYRNIDTIREALG